MMRTRWGVQTNHIFPPPRATTTRRPRFGIAAQTARGLHLTLAGSSSRNQRMMRVRTVVPAVRGAAFQKVRKSGAIHKSAAALAPGPPGAGVPRPAGPAGQGGLPAVSGRQNS
jgi:hypothetical protein